MQQLELDSIIRRAAVQDSRIRYALAYGSLTQGTGDAFSDVEYYLFSDAALTAEAWLRQALEGTDWAVLHATVNEFGTPNFVLTGLIRAEIHVEPPEKLPQLLQWPNQHIFPERMLVKDPDGRLMELLQILAQSPPPQPTAEAQAILDRALNWWVFGRNVLARGERIRALELLGWVQGGALRLARLGEGRTEHWLSPARLAEQELSPVTVGRFETITGGLDDLERCYANALAWLLELAGGLNLKVNPALRAEFVSVPARPSSSAASAPT